MGDDLSKFRYCSTTLSAKPVKTPRLQGDAMRGLKTLIMLSDDKNRSLTQELTSDGAAS